MLIFTEIKLDMINFTEIKLDMINFTEIKLDMINFTETVMSLKCLGFCLQGDFYDFMLPN